MSCRRVLQFVRPLAVAFLPVLAGCGSVPTGPSLSAVKLTDLKRVGTVNRTATSDGDFTVCCCHAKGTLSNGNSVPVHVTITIAAMSDQAQQLGRTVDFAQDLQPGTSVGIEAVGFLMPCATINGNPPFQYQLDVSSLGRSVF